LSPSTVLELSRKGGHVGFIGGSVLRPEYMLDARVSEFLLDRYSDTGGCQS
jgi:hypothetical protein